MKLTNRPVNHVKRYVFGKKTKFKERQNFYSVSDKTKNFIHKVPLTLHLWIGIMHNITTAKEPTNCPS